MVAAEGAIQIQVDDAGKRQQRAQPRFRELESREVLGVDNNVVQRAILEPADYVTAAAVIHHGLTITEAMLITEINTVETIDNG